MSQRPTEVTERAQRDAIHAEDYVTARRTLNLGKSIFFIASSKQANLVSEKRNSFLNVTHESTAPRRIQVIEHSRP